MRLTLDEYCKRFKMSKELVNSKIRAKKLDYVIAGVHSTLKMEKKEMMNL